MHRCSIEVTHVTYASLCDPRRLHDFLLEVARLTRSLTKDEPYRWSPPAQQLGEASEFWTVPLAPRGWIMLEAYLSGEGKGRFTLDICSVNPLEKRRLLPFIDRFFQDEGGVEIRGNGSVSASRSNSGETWVQ